MTRVVLLHGNGGGSGQDNWFPWLRCKLEELGVTCETPNLPDPIEAKSSEWLPYIANVIKADKNTILVGHSSGAIAATRYAETNELAGLVLVGTYYTDLGYDDEKASGYFDKPWNWQAVKEHTPWTLLFASTDDPYIPIDEPRLIKEMLSAEYFEFNERGHFGYDQKTTQFPELLEKIREKLHLS